MRSKGVEGFTLSAYGARGVVVVVVVVFVVFAEVDVCGEVEVCDRRERDRYMW